MMLYKGFLVLKMVLRLKLLAELPEMGHALLFFFSGVYLTLVSDCLRNTNQKIMVSLIWRSVSTKGTGSFPAETISFLAKEE